MPLSANHESSRWRQDIVVENSPFYCRFQLSLNCQTELSKPAKFFRIGFLSSALDHNDFFAPRDLPGSKLRRKTCAGAVLRPAHCPESKKYMLSGRFNRAFLPHTPVLLGSQD